jgi:hypothetical protein
VYKGHKICWKKCRSCRLNQTPILNGHSNLNSYLDSIYLSINFIKIWWLLILFTCGLFKNAASSSGNIASNGMTMECQEWYFCDKCSAEKN